MLIGGLQKITLIDYPAKVAAVVFTAGCNFLCPFCHNPELVLLQKNNEYPFLSEEQFFWWLEKKLGLLEGICIGGGEPTIHDDLPRFIREIKDLGFLVKLDTNGTNPEMLEELIDGGLVDYVAMDIKAPLDKYFKFCPNEVDEAAILQSIELVRQLPEYEFRTTIIPTLHDEEDFIDMIKLLKGSKKYVLQQFRPDKTLDPAFSREKPYPEETIRKIGKIFKPYFEKCEIRM